METMTAQEAAHLLQTAPDDTVLLDVRENVELQLAAIPGALHIPMGEIPARLAELDKGKTIICMCHLGGRSAQVTQYLAAQGYQAVHNLDGGIAAWSAQVDADIPTY